MGNKLKVAIAGFGMTGSNTADFLKEQDDLEFVAVAEPSQERRHIAEEKFGVRTYGDYREMLKKEKIDIFCNKTPNFLHAEVAVAALEAGCHVFSEKPVATTKQDIAAMLKAEEKSGRRIQINFEMRYSRLSCRVKEVIDAGEIGDPKNLLFTHISGSVGFVPQKGDWRADISKVGGYYIEEGCHRLDLMRYYFNADPESVEAIPSPDLRGPNAWHRGYREPACTLCFFPGGKLGNLITMPHRAVFHAPEGMEPELGHEYGVSITGSDGALRTDFWKPSLQLLRYEGPNGITCLNRTESYKGLEYNFLYHNSRGFLRDFIDRMKSGQKPFMSAFDSWKTMAVVFACEESFREEGKRIKVDYSI